MDDIKKILTFQKTGNYLAFSLNVSNEIIELWQNTLNEMYKDGTIENLKKKWLY
jgi:ABC-type amino acid transport substrate-binding protein